MNIDDHLSPILIKEFRQGMRSRVFLGSFFAVQVCLSLLFIIQLAEKDYNHEAYHVWFWLLIAFPILCSLPLSGLSTVSEERKQKTLELIFLTRLSDFKILIGKWFSICSQILILSSAILPFVILRYFLGGVNLWTDLLLFVVIATLAPILTAFSIIVSSSKMHVSLKWLTITLTTYIPLIIFSTSFIASIFFTRSFSSIFSSPFSADTPILIMIALYYIIGLPLFYFFTLYFGCLPISPEAINNTSKIRIYFFLHYLLSMIILGVSSPYLTSSMWGIFPSFIMVLLSILVGLSSLAMSIFSCSEPLKSAPSIYQPFLKFGLFGKIAGRFLYPGWPSGIVFIFSLLIINILYTYFLPNPGGTTEWDDHLLYYNFIGFSIYCMPIVLIKIWGEGVQKVATTALLIHLLAIIPFVLYSIFSDSFAGPILAVFASMFPQSFIFLTFQAFEFPVYGHILGNGFTALYLLLMLLLIVSRDRFYRQMEEQSLQYLKDKKQSRV